MTALPWRGIGVGKALMMMWLVPSDPQWESVVRWAEEEEENVMKRHAALGEATAYGEERRAKARLEAEAGG